MFQLNSTEKKIANRFEIIKKKSGSHSPSIVTLNKIFPDVKIEIDSCFLSNPYATELFFKYFRKDLILTNDIYNLLEYYPSQNRDLTKNISNYIKIPKEKIFIGNGATEIIQAIMKYVISGKVIVNIPTFSPYYEFKNDKNSMIFYQLDKSNGFKIDIDNYITFVKDNEPEAIVIINPNNPDGNYIKYSEILKILKSISPKTLVIVDESFIHFSFENNSYKYYSVQQLTFKFQNLIVIKSMSKDFGIAGLRVGYAIMDEKKVKKLLENGFLWNVNGLAEYFLSVYSNKQFQSSYEKLRKRYVIETQNFFKKLSKIKNIKIYESKANFVLLEILNGNTDFELMIKLLHNYGIYTRVGSDKIGLQGNFLRIASRRFNENKIIVKALKEIFD